MTSHAAVPVGRPVHRKTARPCAAEALEGRVLMATMQVQGFQDSVFSPGYSSPTSMEFAPDGRLFVTQQGGQLRVHVPGNTTPLGTPFLMVQTTSAGERGLLSVTLDPSFMSNGYLYVYYTATTPTIHNRISRFTAVDADPGPGFRPGNTAVPGSELVLMDLETLGASNHNGGAMHFGPDGMLYIATGENAVPSYSQTLSNRLGKILRISTDPNSANRIPTDNPFYNQATGNNRAIWALGLRNPFTFVFEPGTGRMFINDVGASSFEEVNEGARGANYGWPAIEGYRTTQPLPTGPGTYRDPLLAYGRNVGATVTGGAFYRPPVPNFPQQYVGKYFFGDYISDWIRYIDPDVNRPPMNNFAMSASGPVDYEVGPDGALYYLSIEIGTVGRITWAAPRITTQPASRTVVEGQPAEFTVAATGAGTLRYQWRRNGVNIDGATGATYRIDATTAADNAARFSVVVTNNFGTAASDEATLTVTGAPVTVVGRHVFYNNSVHDGRDEAANAADDDAIATDKRALLPGQTASFSNVTSYARGINGIMLDVAGVPASSTVIDANFTFSVSRTGDKWVAAPPRRELTLRRGAGVDGSDRVTIVWEDGAIVNRWLRVTFTPSVTPATPINQDVFYFGNLRGEVGNVKASRLMVDLNDALATRRAMGRATAPIDSAFDHNRDGRVNVLDYTLAQRNRGQTLTLFSAPPPPAGPSQYLSNDTITVGIDLHRGGTITHLQSDSDGRNLVNVHDHGREIQQSYYSGPAPFNPNGTLHPAYSNWPWNPIQAGDVYGNPAAVLAWSNNGTEIYVKTRPMQWALNNYPGDCTFETWITLDSNTVTVRNRLTNSRVDTAQYPAMHQELPAVYTNAPFSRLMTYMGTAPFTGGPTTRISNSGPPWAYWRATEGWAAHVDDRDWGLGVFHPDARLFVGGFHGTPGSGGPTSDSTGYISPIHLETIDHDILYEYHYNLIVGHLEDIRQWVYDHRPDPRPHHVFDIDRQHWTPQNVSDAGTPGGGGWHVRLGSNDPQLLGPPTAFQAADVPKLYIRAKYTILSSSAAQGQLFWERNNAGDPASGDFTEAQSIRFNIIADGHFHTYELDLARSSNYSGLISQLRFDPIVVGSPGDSVQIEFISSLVPDPNG